MGQLLHVRGISVASRFWPVLFTIIQKAHIFNSLCPVFEAYHALGRQFWADFGLAWIWRGLYRLSLFSLIGQ